MHIKREKVSLKQQFLTNELYYFSVFGLENHRKRKISSFQKNLLKFDANSCGVMFRARVAIKKLLAFK